MQTLVPSEDLPSSEERAAYAEVLANDPVRFMREVLPEWFPKHMPWFHRGIIALVLRQKKFLLNFGPESWAEEDSEWTQAELELIAKWFFYDPDRRELSMPGPRSRPIFELVYDSEGVVVDIKLMVSRKMLLMMPRGFAKTTCLNGCITFLICYELRKFIVYASETAGHAEAQLSNVRHELATNSLIQLLFGNLRPDRNHDNVWRNDEFHTLTGIHAVARGRGAQVRGLNRASKRPDIILFDDVEDKESVKTPEQRKKTLDWFKGDVEPAAKAIGGDSYFIGLGTLLHREALLTKLMADPEWITMIFGAQLPDKTMLWPLMLDQRGFERKRLSFSRVGALNLFYMEYNSQLRGDEDSKFTHDMFTYVQRGIDATVGRALVVDPAISSDPNASDCTFAVVGMTQEGLLHVYHVEGRKGMSPREQVNTYFRLYAQFRVTVAGIEAIAYQRALIHLIREEMFRKSNELGVPLYHEVKPISHGRTAKEERILGVLQPRYAARYITHQAPIAKLEEALTDWPNGQMDWPDVLAMAITLLDPLAGLAGTEDNPIANDSAVPIEDLIGGEFGYAP